MTAATASTSVMPAARRSASVPAGQQLHHEQPVLAVLPVVEDTDDVRMVERREQSRLATEPGGEVRVARDRTGELLDRDVAVQLPVARLPDDTEFTPAQLGPNT